jgi:heat shock protein HslJ
MNICKSSASIAVATALALVAQVGAQSQALANTSWQLVQIQNADGTSVRPDDPAKYTLEFDADGSLIARLSCNRGHGTWKSRSAGQLELGVMAVTMAACLPPSLDTRMAKDLGAVHSYAIENGHLHLNLSTGGSYEFEPLSAAGLSNTSWQLLGIENADGTLVHPDDSAKYTLEFDADGSLIARLNCNRGHGTWKSASPGQIEFGVIAMTLAMCLPPSLDSRMAKDLAAVHSYAVENGHLHLNLSTGGFYEFEPLSAAGLSNTSWQLLEIRNADGTSLHPGDSSKYTVTFEADGSLTAQVDCNRGKGTWKSRSPGQIELGPMALTRAMCPPGSLSDRMAKDLSTAQSYTIESGQLRLTLSAGGYYEFEPFSGSANTAPHP